MDASSRTDGAAMSASHASRLAALRMDVDEVVSKKPVRRLSITQLKSMTGEQRLEERMGLQASARQNMRRGSLTGRRSSLSKSPNDAALTSLAVESVPDYESPWQNSQPRSSLKARVSAFGPRWPFRHSAAYVAPEPPNEQKSELAHPPKGVTFQIEPRAKLYPTDSNASTGTDSTRTDSTRTTDSNRTSIFDRFVFKGGTASTTPATSGGHERKSIFDRFMHSASSDDPSTSAASRISKAIGMGAAGAVSLFGVRLRSKQLASLRKSKKIEKEVTRLWRLAVLDDVQSSGGSWTLEKYMDYHLSLYCHLEGLESGVDSGGREAMVDVAWESALEDWETDTAGRRIMHFHAFFDSVFELCECHVEDRSVSSFVEFLTELIDGTTVEKGQESFRQSRRARDSKEKASRPRTWRQAYPKPHNEDAALNAAAEAFRKALLGPAFYESEKLTTELAKGATIPTTEVVTIKSRMAAAKRDAGIRIDEWLKQHGELQPDPSLSAAPATGKRRSSIRTEEVRSLVASIGTPADLLLAMITTMEEVEASEMTDSDATTAAWKKVLNWISEDDAHELTDDASRCRLVMMFRKLGADHVDGQGRITPAALKAALRV